MNSDYLAVAAEENNVEDLRDLLRYGADINFQDWNKVAQTALHAAAQFSHPEVAKLLLAHPEIDVNLQDKGKHTSFYISCGREDSSVFHLVLKDPRVDVNLADQCGNTPLWWASSQGQLGVI